MTSRDPKSGPRPGPNLDPIALRSIFGHDWLAYYDEPLRFSWSQSMGEDTSRVLLSPTELAARADFKLGEAEISPSTRVFRGPGGKTSVEPRVMQVLLALFDAKGRVVSRDALFRQCWGNVTVGEDSLNRIIAEARRVEKSIAPGSFQIETISRTGYRLVTGQAISSGPRSLEQRLAPGAGTHSNGAFLSRRNMIGASVAGAAAVAAGGGAWWIGGPDVVDPRVTALIAQSQQAIRTNLPDSEAQGIGFLEEAVMLQPDSSLAWGSLAIARSIAAEHAPPDRTAAAVQGTLDAARRALALDGRQPDALAAIAVLPPYFGDWFAAEQRMKSVLAVEPNHLPTRDHLNFMYVAVGRAREGSTDRVEIAAREPLHAGHQFKLVYANWILGRVEEADRAADRALQLWPKHPGVWMSRLWTYAFTDRPERALAHLDDAAGRPDFPPPMLQSFRQSMIALTTRRATDIEKAADTLLGLVAHGPSHAVHAVMVLNGLGELDRAFEVAEAYLLERGTLMASVRWRQGQVSINDQHRRKTNMLFVPVSAAMRADPRFLTLSKEIGRADYWSRARVLPDFLQ